MLHQVNHLKTSPIYITFTAITIILYGLVIFFAKYGFDILDEGWYLFTITDPDFTKSRFHYGLGYHYLFLLLNENIIHLRIANIIIFFILAFLLAKEILFSYFKSFKLRPYQFFILCVAMASISLLYFVIIYTPSYNSLAIKALIIIAIGLINILNHPTPKLKKWWQQNRWGALILGFGMFLLFLAKPSSFLAVCFFLLMIFLFYKSSRLLFIIAGIASSSLFSIYIILYFEADIIKYIEETKNTIIALHKLDRHYTWITQLNLLRGIYIPNIAYIFLALPLIYKIALTYRPSSSWLIIRFINRYIDIFIMICLSLGIGLVKPSHVYALQTFFAIMIVYWAILINIFHNNKFIDQLLNPKIFAIILFCFLSPYLFAFGTANIILFQMCLGAILFALCAILLLSFLPNKPNYLYIGILFSQLLTFYCTTYYIHHPYRHISFFSNQLAPLKFYDSHNKPYYLTVSQNYKKLIEKSRSIFYNNGFAAGTPIIDATGVATGIIFALDATPLGRYFLITETAIKHDIKQNQCDRIAKSWLMTMPSRTNDLWGVVPLRPKEILKTYHADLKTDYDFIGNITALNFRTKGKTETINFYRPKPILKTKCKK
ncbi:MAG: hypothetical protein ACR2NY_00495 [Alphaproteobacteria bacterium]